MRHLLKEEARVVNRFTHFLFNLLKCVARQRNIVRKYIAVGPPIGPITLEQFHIQLMIANLPNLDIIASAIKADLAPTLYLETPHQISGFLIQEKRCS